MKPLACALLASVATLGPAPASAASPFLMMPEASVAEASPAYRYANMTNEEALAELDRRKILYLKVDHAPGVRAPIRLTGRLNGVYFHSVLPPEQRVTSMFEILDARLALALDDFAAVLSRHDIDEVVHYTMYRPNVPMRGGEGVDGDGEHGHPIAHAKAADSAVKQAEAADGAAREESTRQASPVEPAPPVELGKKGALDGASKAPDEPPRRLKEKGAAEAGPKEKAAAEAGPTRKGAVEAGSKEKASAGAAPKEKAAAGVAPKEKAAAQAAPKEKAAAQAAPKEKAASEAEPSAASKAPGQRTRTIAARSGQAKAAGKVGARRAARRKAVEPTRATTSAVKHRGDVALRSDAAQKPRGTWAPPGTRHPAGLAIDVGALKKRDGTWISVARHFHGRIGDKTCGEGAPQPELPEARELRSIVCEAADLGIFTYVLTPNFNAAHVDHYHMEIKPGVRWFLYH
ncbi:extensin family protein [Sorangium atrum]|uniref:Extensin family protein n=1 Tax=Sorangium atrum TaxID=2995308 RepID=A0ABT5CCX8_9BACT|nr:extensin family protein [Sorangium aterium]MDC0684302.1 extensin family protein [Sorangium aterium]